MARVRARLRQVANARLRDGGHGLAASLGIPALHLRGPLHPRRVAEHRRSRGVRHRYSARPRRELRPGDGARIFRGRPPGDDLRHLAGDGYGLHGAIVRRHRHRRPRLVPGRAARRAHPRNLGGIQRVSPLGADRQRHRLPALPARLARAPAGPVRAEDHVIRLELVVAAASALFVAVIPFVGSDYLVGFAFTTFLFVGMAYGWNLISGYTGYLSFGQISFFGVGAYATAILVAKLSWPWPPAVLAGMAVAAALAVPLGWAMLRLRGPYFALGMLGSVQV